MEWGPVDTIILHMCTINENHMMYDSWDMKRDRQNVLLFWAIFCSFSVPKTICYTIPEIWRTTDVIIFFILGHFLPFYPLNSPKNQNFEKMKKNNLEISSFYIGVPKIMTRWCTAPEIFCTTDGRTMDGQMKGWMGGWKKWHIEVGAPPKKKHKKIQA